MESIKIILLLHAVLGELGGIAFLWILVEFFNQTPSGLTRAKRASILGVVSLLFAWIIGGYYYLTYYGSTVKPVIKSGSYKWAHSIVMEIKEHVFILIPVLAVVVLITIFNLKSWNDLEQKLCKVVGLVIVFIFLLTMLMAGMGAVIAISARSAVGGGL